MRIPSAAISTKTRGDILGRINRHTVDPKYDCRAVLTGATGADTGGEQASAAGASSGQSSQGSAGDDNVIDAEYVDVDEKK